MKKVCFTIPKADIKSGIVKVVLNLVIELAKSSEFEITVLSIKKITDEISFEKEIPSNVKLESLEIDLTKRKTFIFWLIPKVKKFFLLHNYDTIVVSGMEFIIPFILGRSTLFKKSRLIAWEHRNFYAGPLFRLEWIGKRLAIRYFDNVVCITKKDYAAYKEYSECAPIIQIYNMGNYLENQEDYNLQSKKIISVGSLEKIKGFDMAITVGSQVFDKHNDWKWDIFGEGSELNNLKQKLEEEHLENFISFKGYDFNVNELYKEYAFYCMTSRSEGMGMVIIEAQAAGLPVVSFDIQCGPSDMIEDGQNGFLIETFNIEKMAERINLLIDNPTKRESFSKQAKSKHNEIETDTIVAKWGKILSE